MIQNDARRKIQELVTKYEQVKTSGKLNKYSEQDTKDSFIRPMFEALGWDFDNRDEVSKEEFVNSAGRVDYGIYLNNQPKLFVEAKKLGADIHKPEFAEQAIRYCFNRVVTWAVLTDFETLKVFNAQNVSENLSNKLYFEIPCSQYTERFDQVWQLSKESFEIGLIDKEAMKVGKLQQKITVTEQLAKDLNEIRDLLTHSLHSWNPGVSPTDLDEGVQKLLDRLIFLRVAEDRGIEEPILKQLIRDYKNSASSKQHLYESMIAKFRELDDLYNSGLFSEHPFEKWEEYSGATEKAIDILYGKSGYYEYDFKLIPSDVLGQVYENYLGHLLSKSRKGLTLDVSAKKRKEQGIYYTPSYIEDYIVEHALKPILDNCHSVLELKSIKVLDPACGSGSFLIKAMEMIEKKYIEFGARKGEGIRLQILLDNIYGVDLDEKAVEIARLNLVINSLETRMKLPGLEQHIKNGNSLISGTDEELKKYFGKNYREKKPFNWEEEFPEVFNRPNPGFDVIISNPPYIGVKEQESDFRDYIKSEYKTSGGADIYVAFIEKSMKMIRPSGTLGIICPNKFFGADYGKKLRILIKDKYYIRRIWDLKDEKVFSEALISTIVLIIHKVQSSKVTTIKIGNIELQQNIFDNNGKIQIESDDKAKIIIEKINRSNIFLKDMGQVRTGIMGFEYWKMKEIINSNSSADSTRLYTNGNFRRYTDLWDTQEISLFKDKYQKPTISLNPNYLNKNTIGLFTTKPKLILRGVSKEVSAILDDVGSGMLVAVHAFVPEINSDAWYLMAIINSKLINWLHLKTYYSVRIPQGSLKYPISFYSNIPIPISSTEQKRELGNLSKTMFKFSKMLEGIEEGSNRWIEVSNQIDKVNTQIDYFVYKLYGLTNEEIEILANGKN